MPETLTALPPTAPDDLPELAGHALVLNLLGKLLYEPPTDDQLHALADEAVFDEFPLSVDRPAVADGLAALQQWARDFVAGRPAADYEAVRSDHMHLFLGPGTVLAAPWESAQVDDEHLLFQTETLQVRSWYRRYGLQVIRLHQEPDDHVGLELAFLSHLAQMAQTAQSTGDEAQLTEMLDAQRLFLKTHAQRWIPGWSALVIQHARTEYYRGLAPLTVGVLAQLAAALEPLTTLEVAE
jgi:putative dimethyl sulfoxide reductase chaperone